MPPPRIELVPSIRRWVDDTQSTMRKDAIVVLEHVAPETADA